MLYWFALKCNYDHIVWCLCWWKQTQGKKAVPNIGSWQRSWHVSQCVCYFVLRHLKVISRSIYCAVRYPFLFCPWALSAVSAALTFPTYLYISWWLFSLSPLGWSVVHVGVRELSPSVIMFGFFLFSFWLNLKTRCSLCPSCRDVIGGPSSNESSPWKSRWYKGWMMGMSEMWRLNPWNGCHPAFIL